MATLYVTEFQTIGMRQNRMVEAAEQPPLAEQTVSIGASSTPSSAFNASTEIVRLHTDVVCSIQFGTAPTATTSLMRMAANSGEYFVVPKGQSYKVAVIANT